MNKIKIFFSSIPKNVWFGIKTSYFASKKYFLLKCLLLFSTTFIPLITIWLWKEILNEIVKIDTAEGTVILWLVIYLSLKLLTYLLARFDDYVNRRYSDELQFYIEGVMIEKTSRMDLSFFDSASMGDKVRHARSNFNIMTEMTWLVFDIISEIINIIATLIIVSAYKWWIGVITLVVLLPFMIYNKKHTDKLLKMEKEQLRDNRKQDYYKDVFFNNDIQFEIKLNNIGGYFIKRYKEVWNKLYRINKKEDIRYNIINTGILILNVSSELLALVVSVCTIVNDG